MKNPKSFKIFGPPLSQTWSMESIFKNVKSYDTLYHQFKCYYDEFEGNVNACVAVYNAYLHRKFILLSKQMKKIVKDQKNHDSNVFKTRRHLPHDDKEDAMGVRAECSGGLAWVL